MTLRPAARRYGGCVLLAVAVIGCFFLYRHFKGPLTITEAITSGKVMVEDSFGGAGSPSTFTVIRSSGGMSGDLTIVIPAGTVLYPSDASAQRLITAGGVTVFLPAAIGRVSVQLKTFCLDEFAAIPAVASSLSFAPLSEERTVTAEETEPLNKLADCMSSSSQPDAFKQLAVWAIKDDLLHKSPAEALAVLTNGFEEAITKEQRGKLLGKRPAFMRKHPLLDQSRIDEVIDAEMAHESAQIHDKSARMAREQLKNFLQHDRDLLAACGYDVNEMSIFR